MQRGMSIKKTAKEIGICIQTSSDWRLKVLSVLHTEVPDTLEGRVECDEVELPNQHREFLGKFGSVSTKYLQNYLNWFAYGKKIEFYSNQIKQWFVAIITSDFPTCFTKQSKQMLLISELNEKFKQNEKIA